MKIGSFGHLSYCTNIHKGESWAETFENLKHYLLGVKQQVAKDIPFGIGLRLSMQAAVELSNKTTLNSFKEWLNENQLYVFTINGFPYGNFHAEVIKDQVHTPDWTTSLRKEYTNLLFDILAALLPEGMEGGISTSPLSYRHWHSTKEALEKAKYTSLENLIEVVYHLMQLKKQTGKQMHLDIEPEPDGIIENSEEFVGFFNNYLIEKGTQLLVQKGNLNLREAEDAIREHIQLCLDICHFSVEYEKPSEVIHKMKKNGIRIGKLQLSAALKFVINKDKSTRQLQQYLEPFHEPNYLHQAVIITNEGSLSKYKDLDVAIKAINSIDIKEIRTHFHVPIFLSEYQKLQSTQDDLKEILQIWAKDNFTNHLEIETYTWDVLPNKMQTDITTAIAREINWVIKEIEGKA